MYIMAEEPCPNLTAKELHLRYSTMQTEQELADAYALSSNQFWWVEDDSYDYEEGTPEYQKARDITNAWKVVMEEYENMIFGILRNEGITIPNTGRIEVLIPFMERNGYEDGNGWWIKDAPDYIEAHKYSNNHMEQLKKNSVCGCFYCLKIYSPTEIEEWIIDDNPCDKFGTAVCPYCNIDSVIGESSGYPITEDFLRKMNQHWFNSNAETELTTQEEYL